MCDSGKVVRVNESVVFAASAYHDMTGKIIAHLGESGSITVAEARTMFNSSRKYILPLCWNIWTNSASPAASATSAS